MAIGAMSRMVQSAVQLSSNVRTSYEYMNQFGRAARQSGEYLRNPVRLVGALADKVRQAAQSTREWLDDLFIVSATALAAQYTEALYDIRREARDVFGELTRTALEVQATLRVDDEQVRQALTPLAEINLPLEQIREWAEWSIKSSQVLGISAEETSRMAGDFATFNVTAKAATRAMDKIAGLAHAGYMTMSEMTEVLKDAQDVMTALYQMGDRAFTDAVRGVGLLRAALNTLGVPQWQEDMQTITELMKNALDLTSDAMQTYAYIAAKTSTSLQEIQRLAFEDKVAFGLRVIEAGFRTVEEQIAAFGLEGPRALAQINTALKSIAESTGMPINLMKRMVMDAKQYYDEMRAAGVDTYTALQTALQRTRERWDEEIKRHQVAMERYKEFQKLWGDLKSQISDLIMAFKELGHVFAVEFGKPLLKFVIYPLKLVTALVSGLVKGFIALNERLHGAITYLTVFAVAFLTLYRSFGIVNLLNTAAGYFERLAGGAIQAASATTQAAESVGWFGRRIAALRERSRIFDRLVEGVELLKGKVLEAAGRMKSKLSEAVIESTAGPEVKRNIETVGKVIKKQSSFLAKTFRRTALIMETTYGVAIELGQRMLRWLMTTLPTVLAVLTNPYVLIGTAFVVGLNLFAKYKEDVYKFLETLPQRVEHFITRSLTKTVEDFVALVPDLVGAVAKAIAVAFAQLPEVVVRLVPKLTVALVQSFVALGKATAESFAENFLGTLTTVLLGGYLLKRFVLARFAPSLIPLFGKALAPLTAFLARVPVFGGLVTQATAVAGHLSAALSTVVMRFQKSWTAIDWNKLLAIEKAKERYAALVDAFFQPFRVTFKEIKEQAALLWSALRTQLLKSRLGETIVTVLEGPLMAFVSSWKTTVASAFSTVMVAARGALAALVPLLTNPITLVGVAVVGAVALIWKFRKQIVSFLKSVWSGIKSVFTRVAGWLIDVFKMAFYLTPAGLLWLLAKQVFPEFTQKVKETLVGVLRAIAQTAKKVFEVAFYLTPLGYLWAVWTKVVPKLIEALPDAFSKAFEIVKSIVLAPWNLLKRFVDWLRTKFPLPFRTVEKIGRGMVKVFEVVFGVVKSIVGQAMKVLSPVLKIAKFIWGKAKGLFKPETKKAEEAAKAAKPKVGARVTPEESAAILARYKAAKGAGFVGAAPVRMATPPPPPGKRPAAKVITLPVRRSVPMERPTPVGPARVIPLPVQRAVAPAPPTPPPAGIVTPSGVSLSAKVVQLYAEKVDLAKVKALVEPVTPVVKGTALVKTPTIRGLESMIEPALGALKTAWVKVEPMLPEGLKGILDRFVAQIPRPEMKQAPTIPPLGTLPATEIAPKPITVGTTAVTAVAPAPAREMAGIRRPRPLPRQVMATEPVESEAMSTIAANTDKIVTLLRKIEANTRKATTAPTPATQPTRMQTTPAEANQLTKYYVRHEI